MKSKYLIFLIFLLGLVLTYVYWPKTDKLPVLDKVDPFVLQAVDGTDYDLENNKVKLVTFFYTKCPDICPLTMIDFRNLQAELQKLGLFGVDVELVAITLDPEYDTTSRIREYASLFGVKDEGWKFLRGTPAEIKEIASDYHMKYKKVEGDFISHNTTMFLLDRKNNIRALYDMANQTKNIEKDEILKAMQMIIEEE